MEELFSVFPEVLRTNLMTHFCRLCVFCFLPPILRVSLVVPCEGTQHPAVEDTMATSYVSVNSTDTDLERHKLNIF